MNRKIAGMLLAMLISIVFTCGFYSTGNAALKNDPEIEELKQEYEKLEASVANLQKEVENLEERFHEEMAVIASLKAGEGEVLPIYRANVDDYSREIGMYISMPPEKSLREKLDIMAQKVSLFYFEGLPIEVAEIKTEDDGRKIAVIDLKESRENQSASEPSKYKGASWAVGYFQGSTGGIETSVCLTETFLQKDYKGEWIDGASFTYEGGRVDNFDHIANLAGTNYR